jgi:hypothetical protein
LQFADRFGLDLTNAFPSHFEDASHFFQRIGVAVPQAVAESYNIAIAFCMVIV